MFLRLWSFLYMQRRPDQKSCRDTPNPSFLGKVMLCNHHIMGKLSFCCCLRRSCCCQSPATALEGIGMKTNECTRTVQNRWIPRRMFEGIHADVNDLYLKETHTHTHMQTVAFHFSVSPPGCFRTLPSRKRQTGPQDVEGKFSLCSEFPAWRLRAAWAQPEEGQQRLQGVQDDAQHAAAEAQERWRVDWWGAHAERLCRSACVRNSELVNSCDRPWATLLSVSGLRLFSRSGGRQASPHDAAGDVVPAWQPGSTRTISDPAKKEDTPSEDSLDNCQTLSKALLLLLLLLFSPGVC